jgi:hypothetical protein
MQPYSLIVIPFLLAKQLEYMEKGGHKGTAQRSASTFSPYGIFKFSNRQIFKSFSVLHSFIPSFLHSFIPSFSLLPYDNPTY